MTQTRSKTAANLENALEEIRGKLFALDEKVKNLSETIKRIEDRIQRQDEKVDQFVQHSTAIHYRGCLVKLTEMCTKGMQNLFLKNRNEVNTNDEMYKRKREMIGVWRKLHNERKQAYWNAIRCENLADTYVYLRGNITCSFCLHFSYVSARFFTED
jgi:chromosome segregation ATPase